MKAVLTFGIYTVDEYARASGKRSLSGASVSYGLLQIGNNPAEQEISRFEEISLIFCTSNGTRRTTRRQRMQDVDIATLKLLQRCHQPRTDLLVQDRGASSCLTSAELADCLFRAFPCANLEASDRLLWVFRISLAKGKGYIIEPDGEPLQYTCPPFVVSLNPYKPERSPLRRLIAAQGKRLFRQLGFPKIRQTQVYLSYTNPASDADPIIQLLQNGSNPLVVAPILLRSTLGTNLATGQPNQPTSTNDSDSLKLTPTGDLMLSSGDDGQLVFVEKPGRPGQSVSFLTLLDSSTGLAVSGLDDAVFATAGEGNFYLADTGNNRIRKIEVNHVPVGALFASIGSLKALAVVDIHTGKATTFVGNLNGPHGLEFTSKEEDDE